MAVPEAGPVRDGAGCMPDLLGGRGGELIDMPLEHHAVLLGTRLELEPLRVEHAQEVATLLDDPGLHTYIGGQPATLAQMQERYRRQVVGRSPDGSQLWLNWVARRREDGRAVGTLQATVTEGTAGQDGATVEVACVVAPAYQGQGYAREAAQVMVTWLRAQGVVMVLAHVHPQHAASRGVAQAIGLMETTTIIDGETRWQDPPTTGR